MASASQLCMLVAGACLLAAHAVKLPASNLKTFYREDAKLFHEIWPPFELLDGTLPIMANKPTDISLHDSDLKLGGLEALRDVVYPIQAEKEFMADPWAARIRNMWWLGMVAATVYVIAVWMGTNHMVSREAYHLKKPLALWNLFLAVFSIVGMVRTVPHLVLLFYTYDFEYTICRAAVSSYGNGAVGLWIYAFILSKYVELIDTVFLVLRKKPVNFLHWYHHCTVLMYCWHSYTFAMPTGIYFAAMNYSVHALMYSYYFLAAVMPKPPRWGTFVTVLQLSQMAGGIFVTVCHLRALLYKTVPNCDGHIANLAGALAMYASYFVLFAQFFAKRYCSRKSANGKGSVHGIKRD